MRWAALELALATVNPKQFWECYRMRMINPRAYSSGWRFDGRWGDFYYLEYYESTFKSWSEYDRSIRTYAPWFDAEYPDTSVQMRGLETR